MRMLASAGLATALVGLSAAPALAAGAPVGNGSFESPVVTANDFRRISSGDPALTSFTVTSGSVDLIGSGFWQAAAGVQSLDLDGLNGGAISQAVPTTAGHTYQITFQLAGNPDGGSAVKNLLAGFGGTSQAFTFDRTGKSRTNMGYVLKSFSGTATGASTSLTFDDRNGDGFGPVLDDIRIEDTTNTPALPEAPVSSLLALVGLGALGAGVVLVRRRGASA